MYHLFSPVNILLHRLYLLLLAAFPVCNIVSAAVVARVVALATVVNDAVAAAVF